MNIEEIEKYAKEIHTDTPMDKGKASVGETLVIPLSAISYRWADNVRDALSGEADLGKLPTEKQRLAGELADGMIGVLAFDGEVKVPVKLAYVTATKTYEIVAGFRRVGASLALLASGDNRFATIKAQVIGSDLTPTQRIEAMADHGDQKRISPAGIAVSVRRMVKVGLGQNRVKAIFAGLGWGLIQPHFRIAHLPQAIFDLWLGHLRPKVKDVVSPHFKSGMLNALCVEFNSEIERRKLSNTVGAMDMVLAKPNKAIKDMIREIKAGKQASLNTHLSDKELLALGNANPTALVCLGSLITYILDRTKLDLAMHLESVKTIVGDDAIAKVDTAFAVVASEETESETEETEGEETETEKPKTKAKAKV